ncbi:hypothetical protein [Euzebya tangerina]|uniref:hypothetical protein n=1 Tax=Euzebya tangerina TaxID=591198 RepID=UPI0013C349F9|nr:hypothetical protein [Euzebya tangerina]
MIDTTAIFIHVLAAIGMVGGGVAQVYAGSRARQATTSPMLREWLRAVRVAGFVVLGSAVASLATGGHLAGAVWTTDARSGFSHPFITLGAVALLLLAPVGPMIGGRRIRGLLTDLPDEGPVPAPIRNAVGAPSLWGPVHSLPGVSVALVAVMIYKPESWVVTGVILLVGFALGWARGATVQRGATPTPATG